MKVTKAATRIFDYYAAMDAPELPVDPLSALQVKLCRWERQNFSPTIEQLALGVAEEAGELCHAVLKRSQGIRGMADPDAFRDAAGDAIADCMIYLVNICTMLRLDFGTLLFETAKIVMRRDWKADPDSGGE